MRVRNGWAKLARTAEANLPRYDLDMGINRLLVGYTDGTRDVRVYDGPPPPPPPPSPRICNCSICRPIDPPTGNRP